MGTGWPMHTREDAGTPTGVQPPARTGVAPVTPRAGLSISMVYRAVQILTTAAKQIPLVPQRNGAEVEPGLLMRKPELRRTLAGTISYLVCSQATAGAGVLRLYRLDNTDPTSAVQYVEALNPNGVIIRDDPATGRRTYDVIDDLGRHYTLQDWQVAYMPLLEVPGTPYGLGPIQAAQVELGGAIDLRDYAGGWFHTAGVPSGVLTTDQQLTKDKADEYREQWDSVPAGRTRVIGAGLKYNSVLISPKDAQFLETQQFTVTQIARLFGVPASLMLAAVEGNAQTYANVEQDWIGYVRFTLMDYLGSIEEAFSAMLPNRVQARFKVDALLRSDTLSRYQAHEIALRAGWTDVPEVRAAEGLPPRPDLTRRPPVSSDTPALEAKP